MTAMSWKETAPGRFERPLGAMESFFWNFKAMTAPLNRDQWSLHAFASFNLDDSFGEVSKVTEILRETWIALRFTYPNLAIASEDGKTVVYKVPQTRDDVDKWASTTFFVAADETLVDSVVENFRPAANDMPTLHFMPNTSPPTIMFRTHHWLTDGRGSVMVLDRFFSLLSKNTECISFGSEGSRLSPSLEEAIGSEIDLTASAEEEMRDTVQMVLAPKPSLGLFRKNTDEATGRARSVLRTLEPETTTNVLSACKAKGLTVTAAAQSSLISVLSALDGCDKNPPYKQVAPVDVRARLAPPYNTNEHAMASYISVFKVHSEPGTSWIQRAQELGNVFRHVKEPEWKKIAANLAPTFLQTMASAQQPEKPPSFATPMMSSMGVFDEFINSERPDVRIERVSLAIDMISEGTTIYVWTFGGRLNFSWNYVEAFYDRSYIEGVLSSVIEDLGQGLGVSV